MMNLIEARGLVKRYGNRITVDQVNLKVATGEVVAVIGPNGAGKSTTLEMILGLRQPDGGTVTYWTEEPRREIGVQLQQTPFFPGLTALENLKVFAAFYGLRLTQEQALALLSRCKLADVARTEASRLSGGQQKRLAIAVALVHSPKVIFLDEPTAALDPRARHEVRELIRSVAKEGTAVVFTSHEMEEVGRLADRVVLICEGQVRADGTPADLLAQHGSATLDDLYLTLTIEEVH
jgi:ABC-2 type transport system ATP-binding protein